MYLNLEMKSNEIKMELQRFYQVGNHVRKK